MKELSIAGDQSTPSITTRWADGVLSMTGDSYPENAFELFGPVIQWVEAFLAQDARPLRLELSLLYLNTSSIRAVLDIFDLLQRAHEQGKSVSVRWQYDPRNERVRELAEEFAEDCTFPFEIVPSAFKGVAA